MRKPKTIDPTIITKDDLKFAQELKLSRQLSTEDYNTLMRAWQIQELEKEKRKAAYKRAQNSEI